MPRAGSSTLQEVLFHYAARLEPQGLLYPALTEAAAGTSDRSQRYNHKLLLRSAQQFWRPGRFAALHGEIARQIGASRAPDVMLSYEGWWTPAGLRPLARTVGYLDKHAGGLDPHILAVIRDPVSFLVSLYKLDVLHGRTDLALADYWRDQLADPRLRYGTIAAALAGRFGRVTMLDFDALSGDGRLVGNILAAVGLGDILTKAGLAVLERHRSKGGALFADSHVSLALLAARQVGLRRFQAHRMAIMDIVAGLASREELAGDLGRAAIGLPDGAADAILAATRPELDRLREVTGFGLVPRRREAGAGQVGIDPQSAAGRALIEALQQIG